MKKGFFIVVIVLLANVVFAQELVYTSEGEFIAKIHYEGQFRGQYIFDNSRDIGDAVSVKLTNVQMQVIRKMLGKYITEEGDTYQIEFSPLPKYGLPMREFFIVICEFVSNTQYNYWVLRMEPASWR